MEKHVNKNIRKVAKVYSPNGLEEFQHEEIGGVIFRHTDVGILFNQQRLNKLSPLALDNFIANIKASSPDVKAPDDVLRATVKSRYIQSVTDIANYSRNIERELDSLIQDAQERAEVESLLTQQQTQQTTENNETE